MSCCRGSMRDRLLQIQARLETRAPEEAQKVGRSIRLLDRFFGRRVEEDQVPEDRQVTASKKRRVKSKMPRVRQAKDEPDLPAAVKRYYDECLKKPPATAKGREKEYCKRVAWQIFCSHKDPSYPGCTEYGKTKKSLPK